MKKIKIMLVAIVAGIMIFTAMFSAVALKENYIRGDANADSKVTVADVTAIQKKLLSVTVTSFNEQAADVDGNGLNLADAIKIQRYLVGYDNNSYRIGETIYDNDDEYELPFIPAD